MSDSNCRCGRPTRDAAYVCDTCADSLSRALGEIPWLDEQLETTITGARGVDYRTKGGTRASERPSPVVWSASEARAHLRAVLVQWVLFCGQEHVRNQSPSQLVPEDTLVAMSRYLMWRVDGLTLLDIGPEAVDEITDAVAHCARLIDRPAPKQYLGICRACVTGRLYAKPRAKEARCEACDATVNADDLRTNLLARLDDRLCTAAEIARLSTYLGLRANRDQVRQRINQWHSREIISGESMLEGQPAYRFGDIYKRLVAAEYAGRRRSA